MKQPYEVISAFWYRGVWREAGEVLMLTEDEAKYLVDHNLKKRAA